VEEGWEREIKEWMINEYLNGTLEQMKAKILEFKRTRNPRIFSLLCFGLISFGWVCSKFKWKFTFLTEIPIEDLYHTAILGTYKSFISMRTLGRQKSSC